jgi:hypothetical protein
MYALFRPALIDSFPAAVCPATIASLSAFLLFAALPLPSAHAQSSSIPSRPLESVTTPAGTYANAARINFDLAFSSAAGSTPSFSSNIATVSWYAPSVGMVKSTSDSRFTTQISDAQNYETRSVSDVQLIAVAGS